MIVNRLWIFCKNSLDTVLETSIFMFEKCAVFTIYIRCVFIFFFARCDSFFCVRNSFSGLEIKELAHYPNMPSYALWFLRKYSKILNFERKKKHRFCGVLLVNVFLLFHLQIYIILYALIFYTSRFLLLKFESSSLFRFFYPIFDLNRKRFLKKVNFPGNNVLDQEISVLILLSCSFDRLFL